jgi:hypothetical protein
MRFLRMAALVAGLLGLFSVVVATSANAQFDPGGAQATATPTRATQFPGPGGAQATATPTRATQFPGPGGAQVTPTPTRGTPSPGPSGVQQPRLPLVATLIGAAERPEPGDQDGVGSAAIMIDPAQGTVCYALHVANIEPAIAAHIHQGGTDTAGPIVVHLNPPTDGNASACTEGVEPDLLTRIMQDPRAFYVNVHNAEFPDGAVRGQLGQ